MARSVKTLDHRIERWESRRRFIVLSALFVVLLAVSYYQGQQIDANRSDIVRNRQVGQCNQELLQHIAGGPGGLPHCPFDVRREVLGR